MFKIKAKKIVMFVVLFSITLVSVFRFNTNIVEADSASWNVYYRSGGGSGETTVLAVYNYAGTYRAKCSTLTGNCTSKVIKVKAYTDSSCTNEWSISSPVNISSAGEYVDFKLNTMRAQEYVYFKVTLSHSGGTTANSTGTIRTR